MKKLRITNVKCDGSNGGNEQRIEDSEYSCHCPNRRHLAVGKRYVTMLIRAFVSSFEHG